MGSSGLPSAGTSISDILTALKNLVEAVNNASRAYLNVNGVSTQEAISAATLVKGSPGRVAGVSVTTAGSAAGAIYDSSAVGTLTNKLWVIPNTVGFYSVPLPTNYGLVVVPGTGQVVAVSWS
jgi:hypothetical protein